jgi:uncharacterized membrane protein YidH (DUF202 family)
LTITSRSERDTQPERTSLAWTRTSLAVLANGVLLLLRDTHSALQFVAAGSAAVLALSTYLIGLRRQRILARQPLPDRISPRREVYLTGVAIIALTLITTLSLTI